MVSRTLILLAVVGYCSAATWLGKLPPKPLNLAHKFGCYVKEVDDVIPFGQYVSPIGSCLRIDCGRSMIYYASCGVAAVAGDTDCYLTEENLEKPYPDCCPQIKCIDENKL
ncbi:unnamed protein product [Diatraea saccharalis]|uniref:Single domain-containing protein n=1 Tax=Diatraea saccharalis TaxID=40085 RepID=A0A9N9R2J4_9NEOP|nr:unnamed protein product [Diatraea saccharalis]